MDSKREYSVLSVKETRECLSDVDVDAEKQDQNYGAIDRLEAVGSVAVVGSNFNIKKYRLLIVAVIFTGICIVGISLLSMTYGQSPVSFPLLGRPGTDETCGLSSSSSSSSSSHTWVTSKIDDNNWRTLTTGNEIGRVDIYARRTAIGLGYHHMVVVSGLSDQKLRVFEFGTNGFCEFGDRYVTEEINYVGSRTYIGHFSLDQVSKGADHADTHGRYDTRSNNCNHWVEYVVKSLGVTVCCHFYKTDCDYRECFF